MKFSEQWEGCLADILGMLGTEAAVEMVVNFKVWSQKCPGIA